MTTYPFLVGDTDPVLRQLHAPGAWWRIGSGMLVGLVLAATWVLWTRPTYDATVAVVLSQVAPAVDIEPTGPDADEVSIDTDAQLVSADGVVAAVAEATGAPSAEVRKSLRVTARPLSRVLELTYTGDSRAAALAGASAAATALLGERDRLVIEPVRSYLMRVSRAGMGAPPATEASAPPADTTLALSTNEVRRRLAITQEMRLPGPGKVLESARITADKDRGDIEVPLASGAAAGALLALLVMMVRSRRRRRAQAR